jgi:hypothetical protein
MNPHIIINPGSTKVWAGETIIQRSLTTDAACSLCPFHEDPVPFKEADELFQYFWILL